MSPDAGKRRAHVGGRETLLFWVQAAARILKDAGTLTLIWRADGLEDVRQALAGAFGDVFVQHVHPAVDAQPIRVLVRATKGAPARETALAGLTLNDASGRPSAAAEEILRAGKALPIAEISGR